MIISSQTLVPSTSSTLAAILAASQTRLSSGSVASGGLVKFGARMTAANGKYIGTEVLEGHPLAGSWISVAFSNQIKLANTGGAVVIDDTAPMQGYAKSLTSAQNAAILWGTVTGDGTATFDGMSPDFANPSCMVSSAGSAPYGGRIFYIADGLWNYAVDAGGGTYTHLPYPLVWDKGNNLTAVLLFNISHEYSNVEYNTFVRCTPDVTAVEAWLNQFVCE